MIQDSLRPVVLVFELDPIRVQRSVDLFEEFQAYYAVVGAFVDCNDFCSGLGVL